MDYYISGDTITSNISTIQFFPINYFNTYIRDFTENNNLIHSNENSKDDHHDKIIFITKIEYLDIFYNKIVKSLNRKFVLITHYGAREAGLYNEIIKHPLLIKWYGQNMNVSSSKTIPIPLGLENKYWKRTNIHKIKKHSTNSKNNLLYLNFSLKTNPNRPKIMSTLLNKGFNKNKVLDWNNYIEDLSRYKFCISPKGKGVDCHRTWECLYLGVIPIVEKSIHMNYFDDLPILFVDNYDIISIEYLNKMYDDFQKKTFNMDKLSISYWKKKIEEDFTH